MEFVLDRDVLGYADRTIHAAHPRLARRGAAGRRYHPTLDDIGSVVRQLEGLFPGHDFQVATLRRARGWKSGKWFRAGTAVRVFNPYDMYETAEMVHNVFDDPDDTLLDDFTVFVRPGRAGGAGGDSNDCLFDALLAYGVMHKGAPNTAAALKEALRLRRDDLVPVESLPAVEVMYGIRIALTGDATYAGQTRYTRELRLSLQAGHYEPADPINLSAEPLCDPDKSPFLFWFEIEHGFVVTEKRGVVKIPRNKLQCLLADRPGKRHSPHRYLKLVANGRSDGDQIDAAFASWRRERQALLPLGVDMFVTPKLTTAATLHAARLWKAAPPAQLAPVAEAWVSGAMAGGLIWARRGARADTELDFKSFYPSLLIAKGQTWPCGPGEFQTLQGQVRAQRGGDLYWPYGIYRAVLPKRDASRHSVSPPLYRWHPEAGVDWGYYTHYDLQAAELAGVSPVLAADGQANALIWPPSQRLLGNAAMGDFVRQWFTLKEAAVVNAKTILTCLWGALCQSNERTYRIARGGKIPGIPLEIARDGPNPDAATAYQVRFAPDGQSLFRGKAPAIAPFLLARGRLEMARTLQQYGSSVVRVHTDGMFLALGQTERQELVDSPRDDDDPMLNFLRQEASATAVCDSLGLLTEKKRGDFLVVHANRVVDLDEIRAMAPQARQRATETLRQALTNGVLPADFSE